MNPLKIITTENPYVYYSTLLAENPFHYDEGLGLWVAADASTVEFILLSDAVRVRPLGQDVPAGIAGGAAGDVFGELVRMTDGDVHLKVKSVVVEALSSLNEIEVVHCAQEAADHLSESGINYQELMFLVPAYVTATLCGFSPREARVAVKEIADFVGCIPASATVEQQNKATLAAEKLLSMFEHEFSTAENGMLLKELLLAATSAGWADKSRLVANAIGFLSQSYDATAGLIGNSLLAIQREQQTFESDDQLMRFIREVARHDAPIQNTRRFVSKGITVNGVDLEPGQQILLLLAAANRDPRVNDQPNEFLTERQNPRMFTFGAGAHRCPGEKLAVSITAGVIKSLISNGGTLVERPKFLSWMTSGNARIPKL